MDRRATVRVLVQALEPYNTGVLKREEVQPVAVESDERWLFNDFAKLHSSNGPRPDPTLSLALSKILTSLNPAPNLLGTSPKRLVQRKRDRTCHTSVSLLMSVYSAHCATPVGLRGIRSHCSAIPPSQPTTSNQTRGNCHIWAGR